MRDVQISESFSAMAGQMAASGCNHSTKILGIAACRSGDGATFVSESLAFALALRTKEQVLATSVASLSSTVHDSASAILASCRGTSSHNLWTLPSAAVVPSDANITASDIRHVVDALSTRFRFILIDCGAIGSSGTLWSVAQVLEEVVLVVAAGETKRAQIAYAQRSIARSGFHLVGCILNKRTYPLPESIYRIFA